MKQILLGIFFLIAAHGLGYSSSHVSQGEIVPEGWKRVSACNVTFLVPAGVGNLDVTGIDSCVAAFGDGNLRISIDYGRYGYDYKKNDPGLDQNLSSHKEWFIKVGGKRAKVVTYLRDPRSERNNPPLPYIAGMYVLVHTDKSEGIRTNTSLNMLVEGMSEKEQEIAKRIFRSVRFQ